MRSEFALALGELAQRTGRDGNNRRCQAASGCSLIARVMTGDIPIRMFISNKTGQQPIVQVVDRILGNRSSSVVRC